MSANHNNSAAKTVNMFSYNDLFKKEYLIYSELSTDSKKVDYSQIHFFRLSS